MANPNHHIKGRIREYFLAPLKSVAAVPL